MKKQITKSKQTHINKKKWLPSNCRFVEKLVHRFAITAYYFVQVYTQVHFNMKISNWKDVWQMCVFFCNLELNIKNYFCIYEIYVQTHCISIATQDPVETYNKTLIISGRCCFFLSCSSLHCSAYLLFFFHSA